MLADTLDLETPDESNEGAFLVSPVTIWEILLTNDRDRRERLIYCLQRVCNRRMLPSPSELILAFAESGCPRKEPYRELRSELQLALTWQEVCEDHARTFVYDFSEWTRRGKFLRDEFGRLARFIVKPPTDPSSSTEGRALLGSLDRMIGCDQRADTSMCRYGSRRAVWRLSALFELLLTCSEADIDPTPSQQFWARHGVRSIRDRVELVLRRYPQLLYRGPLAAMGIVAYHQLNDGSESRGMVWDCLHAAYLDYVDGFLTNDAHFVGLDSVLPHPNLTRVLLVSDLLRQTRGASRTQG